MSQSDKNPAKDKSKAGATSSSIAELRKAIDIKLNSMFGQNYVETDEGTLFTTEIADELLSIFQAREQHPSTIRGYQMGYKAGQQQLLTELLGQAILLSEERADGKHVFPAVPVEVIQSKIGELNGHRRI